MKSLFIIIITSLVLFAGCTKDVQVVKEEKIPEVKTEIISPWPEDKKHMHVTMYFTRMAQQPGLRARYQPENLYNICKCVLDTIEKSYSYQDFLTKFEAGLTAESQQIIYNVTYQCSVQEVQKMKQLLPQIELKDTI
jgi:hypothetical protein